jgi:WD40 repeat protein
MSPDGGRFAVRLGRRGAGVPVVKVGEVSTGRVLGSFPCPPRGSGLVFFSADGALVAQAGSKEVRAAATGEVAITLDGPHTPQLVSFEDSGKWVAGGDARKVCVWHGKSGKLAHTFDRHPAAVEAVRFVSPFTLASACQGAVHFWDLRGGRLLRTVANPAGRFGPILALGPGGDYLAAARGKEIALWDLGRGKEEVTLRGAANPFSALAFTGDGKYLAAGGFDNTVRLFLVRRRPPALVLRAGAGERPGFAIHPGGGRLAATRGKGGLKVFDPVRGMELGDIPTPTEVRCVAYAAGGEALVCGCADGKAGRIILLDAGGKVLWSLPTSAAVTQLAVSRRGPLLAYAEGRAVHIWDHAARKMICSLPHPDAASCPTFGPEGKTLATACNDGSVRVWDLASAEPAGRWAGHAGRVYSLAFSPNGSRLAFADAEGVIRVWGHAADLATRELVGHTFAVHGLAWNAAGDRLLSSAADGAVNVWDAGTGQLLLSLRDLDRSPSVHQVAFTPDGRRLAAMDSAGNIAVYSARD